MKKELDITKIMDEYTDNEFCIEGEQAVDTEKAVGDLLARVRQKKRIKPVFKALIAAAAAVCVLGGTAAIGIGLSQYGFTTNTNIHVDVDNDSGDKSFDMTDPRHPFRLEEGRIIFTADGGETDITDLIDENTPYIYEYVNPETGGKCCIIIGGTPDFPGYVDLFRFEGEPRWSGIGINYRKPVEPESPAVTWTETDARGNENQFGMFESEEQHFLYDKDCQMPWFAAAWDMLGAVDTNTEPNVGGMPSRDFSAED